MDWFTSSSSSRPVKTVEFYQRKVVSFLFSAEGRDGKDLYLDRNEMKAILFTKSFDYILITCFLPHYLDAYGKFNLIRRIFLHRFPMLKHSTLSTWVLLTPALHWLYSFGNERTLQERQVVFG